MAPSRAYTLCRNEMAACAGFAPAEEAEGNSGCWWTGEQLPLDRRLLFVAELTGHKWCGVRVMLPISPNGRRFYRPTRVFSGIPPREIGCGTWSCTTM